MFLPTPENAPSFLVEVLTARHLHATRAPKARAITFERFGNIFTRIFIISTPLIAVRTDCSYTLFEKLGAFLGACISSARSSFGFYLPETLFSLSVLSLLTLKDLCDLLSHNYVLL